MSAASEALAMQTASPPAAPVDHADHKALDPLAFLNKINGLLMALAVGAWALLGNEYREDLKEVQRAQSVYTQTLGELRTSVTLLKQELEIRVGTARGEHDNMTRKAEELELRMRQLEQQAVRSEQPRGR